jgi:hypothetical protein
MADDTQAGSGWEAAAQPEAGTSPGPGTQPYAQSQQSAPSDPKPPAGPMATTETPSTGQVPEVSAGEQPPVVLTPLKQGGILGVVQNIADALTGRTRPELAKDQDGNTYVKQNSLTKGQQWARIGAGIVAGAAKGLAAGRGNNLGAAAGAGFDEGQRERQQQEQQQKDMTAEARQRTLDNANNQMLQMNRAEQAWKASRLKVVAGQEDVKFEQGQIDRLVQQGGRVLGTAQHAADIGNILKVQPDVMAKMIQDHQLELKTAHNEDGTVAGITAVLMPAGHRDQIVPAGTTGHHWNAVTQKMEEFKYSDPQTQGTFDDNETAAGNAREKFNNEKAEQELKAQQAAAAKERARVIPSEILKNNAEAARAFAAAAKDKTLGKDDPQVAQLGEAIARGGISVDMIPGFSKNKAAIEAYLSEHHPNLDQKSAFLTGEERKRGDLSRNALHNLDTIDQIVSRRPDLVDYINGRVSQGKHIVGTNDPDLAAMNTALDNYALAATGAHGIRAVQARVDTRGALLNDFKNGPKAIKSSINTARGSLRDLASAGQPRGLDGNLYVYKQGAPAGPVTPPQTTAQAAGVPPGKFPATVNGQIVGYADDANGKNYIALGAK